MGLEKLFLSMEFKNKIRKIIRSTLTLNGELIIVTFRN